MNKMEIRLEEVRVRNMANVRKLNDRIGDIDPEIRTMLVEICTDLTLLSYCVKMINNPLAD